MNTVELRRKRAGLITEARSILNEAETADRDLTEEERSRVDGFKAEAETLLNRITRAETFDGLEAEMRTAGDGASLLPHRTDKKHSYSILKAIRQAAAGQEIDGIEGEVSQEIATRSGKQPHSFYVPLDLPGVVESRALTTSTASGAVPTITDMGNFIEMFRARLLLDRLGARVLTGLAPGTLSLPKQTGGGTAYWVPEGTDVTASNQVVGQVALTPKTVGAQTAITRKTYLQTSLDVEAFVRADLAAVLARAISKAAFVGSGSGAEPLGLANDSNIATVALNTNGGALTYAALIALESAVDANDAMGDSAAYVTNSKVRASAKAVTTIASSTFADFLWKVGPDTGSGVLNGYPAYTSNLIPSNLTKGSGTGLSPIFFGVWSDYLVGMWGGMDVIVDPYTQAGSGGVRIVMLQDVDLKYRHAESFSKAVDVIA